MSKKEDALSRLTTARSRLTAVRAQIDEELRALRAQRLQAYRGEVTHLILSAFALGASMGEIKRAYGTKDHRTVSAIIHAGEAEIEALRKAEAEQEAADNWFTVEGSVVTATWAGDTATFDILTLEDDDIMLSGDTPRWNEDYTVENKAVAKFDGVTSDESAEVEAIRKAWLGTLFS